VKRWLRFIEQAADDCIRHAAAMGDLPDEAS
jgi:hypothetical protein